MQSHLLTFSFASPVAPVTVRPMCAISFTLSCSLRKISGIGEEVLPQSD